MIEPSSLSGSANGVVSTLLGPITSGAGALAGVGLAAVGSWVLDGARAALTESAHIIATTTAPQLQSTWFSATYWRVAGLGALLTVPFLFAAAIQAVLRSDPALLARAALAYLPLAVLGVTLAAPIAMLLLAATDQMCAIVSGAGAGGGARFLQDAAIDAGGLSALDGSAFFAFVVGLFTAAAAIALTLEMLVREAAVYIVVLMLPLAFAAFVWPARRIWAIRLVELLVSLILSKFAIVAVLSLAGAAYGQSGATGPSRLLTAMALVLLSTFAPWTMMRLLPFTELAAGAAGAMRSEVPSISQATTAMKSRAGTAEDWATSLAAMMRRQAGDAGQSTQDTRSQAVEEAGFAGSTVDGAGPQASAERGARGTDSDGSTGSTDRRGVTGVTEVSEVSEVSGVSGVSGVSDGSGDTGGDPRAGGHADGAGDRSAHSPGASEARRERLPGLGPIFQADNQAWPPMTLGPDGWSGPTAYQPPSAPIDRPTPTPGGALPTGRPAADHRDPGESYDESFGREPPPPSDLPMPPASDLPMPPAPVDITAPEPLDPSAAASRQDERDR